MLSSSPTPSPTWPAQLAAALPEPSTRLNPMAVDPTWQPLTQPWLKTAGPSAFHPRWAKVSWSCLGLCYDVVFLGPRHHNRACRLNERTWELGDVCELFLQLSGQSTYLELHVTPENHRLQLLWPLGGMEYEGFPSRCRGPPAREDADPPRRGERPLLPEYKLLEP